MTSAELTAAITRLQAALESLVSGTATAEVRLPDGSMKSFQPGDVAALRVLISDYAGQLAALTPTTSAIPNRPIVPWF